jgi:hypothetical protein
LALHFLWKYYAQLWSSSTRQQTSQLNSKLEEICQNSSWDPNPANFKYYLWYQYKTDETRRKQQTDAELWSQRWWATWKRKQATLCFLSCTRETQLPGLLTVNPWTPLFSFFLCPSHAPAKEYFSFTARAHLTLEFCVFARAYFSCWLTKP